MMDMIRDDLAALNITHEVFFSERTSARKSATALSEIDRQIEELRAKGLVYEGRLPPPKGQLARGLGGSRADLVPLHATSATTWTVR